ncbi:MAG TPA: hypothetical protein VFC21_09505 [Bryobacteraceae bacterium]|nr:hypothetical protein [Bryobacteraceae bacterium]
MIQYRRIAGIVLGIWLGAATFADIAVTQNFDTVDRFLRSPGSSMTAIEIDKIGNERLRPVLRRNAGEENNFLFENWETAELAVAALIISLLFAGGKPSRLMLSLAFLMMFIVAVQRFYLSPEVAALGRRIADLPANDPLTARFWKAHGIYSGLEIGKLLLGAALAVRLSLRRRRDSERMMGTPETELIAGLNG